MSVKRNDFDSARLKQRKVCDIRTMVRVDENLEVRSELKAVLMQIPGGDRIVTKSWPRKMILTNFDRIKLDERAYIKHEISTLV